MLLKYATPVQINGPASLHGRVGVIGGRGVLGIYTRTLFGTLKGVAFCVAKTEPLMSPFSPPSVNAALLGTKMVPAMRHLFFCYILCPTNSPHFNIPFLHIFRQCRNKGNPACSYEDSKWRHMTSGKIACHRPCI